MYSTMQSHDHRFFPVPLPGVSLSESNEAVELKHLSKIHGWTNPQGLYKDSADSDAYFDYADKSSAVNAVATKAFSMYG